VGRWGTNNEQIKEKHLAFNLIFAKEKRGGLDKKKKTIRGRSLARLIHWYAVNILGVIKGGRSLGHEQSYKK